MVLSGDAYIYIHIVFNRLWWTLAELSRTQQNLIKLVEFSRILSSVNFTKIFILAEFGRSRSSQQNLAELGRTLLLSILPRHFYCNQVSPVTPLSLILFLLFSSKLLEILKSRDTRGLAFINNINILTISPLVAVNCRRLKEVYNKCLAVTR